MDAMQWLEALSYLVTIVGLPLATPTSCAW